MEEFMAGKLLQQTLDYAIACEATDIHLTVSHGGLQIDFRVDGGMQPFVQLASRGEEMTRRIKALAHMDVTDRFNPQEGAFTWEVRDEAVRIRVSSVPIFGGESLVMRVLRQPIQSFQLHQLGLSPGQLSEVMKLLEVQSGLILVAGCTGVGKTTTLYAMMHYLAERGRQVFSIEDPVEVPLGKCRQIEVRERTGLTYDVGLRALLRQDPDVLMIGEIRDETTAQAALRAALTGRLVLATTHAANAQMTVARLVDLGAPKEVLIDVLRAVLLQHTDAWLAPGGQRHTTFSLEWCDALHGQAGAVFSSRMLDEERPSDAVLHAIRVI